MNSKRSYLIEDVAQTLTYEQCQKVVERISSTTKVMVIGKNETVIQEWKSSKNSKN